MLDDGGVGRGAVTPALDEGAAQRQIARGDEHESQRRGAVTPGAPDLLVIRLQRARGPQVNDSAHVRPVYAHAEGVGGHDDVCPALQEVALGSVSLSGREPRVVHARAPAEPREPSAFLLGGASGGRVDDGGAIPRGGASERFGERSVHAPISLAPALHLHRSQRQVRPGKAPDELRCVGGQPETRQDLVADHGGGGGRAGEHPGAGELREERADL